MKLPDILYTIHGQKRPLARDVSRFYAVIIPPVTLHCHLSVTSMISKYSTILESRRLEDCLEPATKARPKEDRNFR